MRTLNRIVLIGRLGQDPEVRTPASGTGQSWGSFPIATTRNRRDGNGGWTEETDWHGVKVFGKEAEYCQRNLRKGALVSVEGTVVQERWTGNDGTKNVTARILADRVSLLSQPAAAAPPPERELAEVEMTAELC
jgi:single-strand DNA-binding protein